MSTRRNRNILAALGALALLTAWPAHAQRQVTEVQSLEAMKAEVRKNMPDFLKGNNRELVDHLLKVPLADPLSKTFDANQAIKEIFGDGTVVISADCRRRGTASGDPDQGDCVASNGVESGRGAFVQLSYSKNMGNGNLRFLKRGLVRDGLTPAMLPSAKLSDADALKAALEFLVGTFRLPLAEVPGRPSGAKGALVRTLASAGGTPTGAAAESFPVQKVVFLQRGLPLGMVIEGPNKQNLTHVPLPGRAIVGVDDTGVAGAIVDGWQELHVDPNMTADQAKSGDVLIDEIAEDLFNNGVRSFSSLNFSVAIGSDWRGSFGLLLPAVQVALSPVPHDLSEDAQRSLERQATAGIVKDYALVERANVEIRQ